MIKLINILSELIDPSEAYSDIDAINTVADGKRKIAFIVEKSNNKDNWKRIQKVIADNNLKTVYVKGNSNHAYIVYTPDNIKNAMELKNIAEKYDGYLSANATKEDTKRIGELLEYTDDKIQAFINKNYPDETSR
jgi:tRNA G10  N-methylase Trm11